ncbi:type VII secretion integral membrane protein EccD [Streptomyces sp. DSM 40750]|uniref:type VII secretion integral membrane protein EccD n=1 Tax=Streptomyces sp. DSM 40750 TaxID=2801030 RepID=UPI00214AF870|nr:type VII secretion integral membrane protein EccD [Streptomyces sp. DSM 40750]UUU23659.1 type VII secretion integral membrane protein EccD [Streptomyces sp. DSM 40750]
MSAANGTANGTANVGVIVAELTRLVVHAPERVIDIAVPSDAALADLLPALVGHAAPEGTSLDESGLEHGGWVLQRLGSPALDEDATPAELGLRDGETVYLRPRREQLPPVHFDDLIDGVSTGMGERSDQWRPEFTRRLLLGLAVAALAAGFVVLAGMDVAGVRSGVAMGLGVLLLLGAFAASRAMGDAVVGTVLGVLAVPFFGLAGWLVPSGPEGPELLGARLLAGATAAAGGAVLAVSAAAATAALFAAVVLVCLLGAAAGIIGLSAGLGPSETAGSIAALTALLGTFVPVISFRLSGLALPPLPTNAAQLQEGIDPLPARAILTRTAVADRYMTALYGAAGLVCVACLTALSAGSGWEPYALGGVLSLLLVLHGRGMTSARQHLAVVLPGCYGALLLPVVGVWADGAAARGIALAVAAAACAGLVVAAWHVPGRRFIPYWGRAADLLHSLAAVALLPLVLIDLGVLPALREMWS